MKTNSTLNNALVSIFAAASLCFAACSDDAFDSPADSTIKEQASNQNAISGNETEPTTDQMSVTVNFELPTASIGSFDGNSTGAALLKRLPLACATIDSNTQFVLLKGSEMPAAGDNMWKAIYQVYKKGGYVGIETPTQANLKAFNAAMANASVEQTTEELQQQFKLTRSQAIRSARQSDFIDVQNTRIQNIEAMSHRACATEDANATMAEMIIFGHGGYFMQEPLETENTILQYSEYEDGNKTKPESFDVTCERNGFYTGQLADGAATWLNEMNAERQQKSKAGNNSRRAGAQDYIDADLIGERFTFNGRVDYRSPNNSYRVRYNRVVMNIRSCGVHNITTKKDYYYIKQDVTLSMGNQAGWTIYECSDIDAKSGGEKTWLVASNRGEWNHYYGAFLSKYTTSMNLTGKGNIHLEAATPSTDNYTETTSISVGSSFEKSEELGLSWGGELGMEGPKGNVGGSWSRGATEGSSFEMGHGTEKKELSIVKRTCGNTVSWDYKGALPTAYTKTSGNIFKTHYDYCHTKTPDILCNDADLNNEVCWSVTNPSGQYKLDITSYPETASLLKVKGEEKTKYEYTTANGENNVSFTLREPNRASQSWRMNILIDEWENGKNPDARGLIEDDLTKHFSDVYVPQLHIFDKTSLSLDVIRSFIQGSKQVFDKNIRALESIATERGVKQYTIIWTCDDVDVKLQDTYTVTVCPKATEANSSYVGWIYGSNGYLYPSVGYAEGHGQKAIGILAYYNDGSDFGNAATEKASGAGHGLVIALHNASTSNARINRDKAEICTPASGTGYTQYVDKNTGMAAALTDFDGLAKTKHLLAHDVAAAWQATNYGVAAPSNTTGWFIPATGQWLAIFCSPGLGGAKMPDANGAFYQKFNVNPATQINKALREQGGSDLRNKTWTSSAYWATTGIYFNNDDNNPNFTWYNWQTYCFVRPVLAF